MKSNTLTIHTLPSEPLSEAVARFLKEEERLVGLYLKEAYSCGETTFEVVSFLEEHRFEKLTLRDDPSTVYYILDGYNFMVGVFGEGHTSGEFKLLWREG